MLLPDSINGDAWRSLRIWLRHKAVGGADLAAGRQRESARADSKRSG
jgi:hypothetical protein